MKQFISLLILLVVSGTALWAQQATKENLQQLYPFDGKVLNLESLQYVIPAEALSSSFKTDSKYSVRFKGTAVDKLAHQGVLFEILDNNSLFVKDLSTQVVTPLFNREKGLPTEGSNLLLEAADGVICIKLLKADNRYRIYKYNKLGKELFSLEITHSEFVQHKEFTYCLPYLEYLTHTASHVVFTSYVNRIPKTVVLNTLDGSLSNFDFSSIAIIREAKMDMDVRGFIQLNRANNSIQISYAGNNFELQNACFKNSTHIKTLLLDQTLVLTAYNSRSSEVHLLAIDLSSQTLKWETAVNSLGRNATDAYFNTVWLSAYEGKIILEAYETKGKHLQIFNDSDGQLVWKSF